MSRTTEACFLPTYFASNSSHEERLAAIRDALPESMAQWIEEMIADIGDDPRQNAINEAWQALEKIDHALRTLELNGDEDKALDLEQTTVHELPGAVDTMNDHFAAICKAHGEAQKALAEFAE